VLLWPLAKSQQLNPISSHQISHLIFLIALIILWNKSWPQIIWVINTHIGRSLIGDKGVPMHRPHLPKHGAQTYRNWFIHSFQILCDKHSCFFSSAYCLGEREPFISKLCHHGYKDFFSLLTTIVKNTYIPIIMLKNILSVKICIRIFNNTN
jgi:hypothetical protein